jgi:hypothetical protein
MRYQKSKIEKTRLFCVVSCQFLVISGIILVGSGIILVETGRFCTFFSASTLIIDSKIHIRHPKPCEVSASEARF